MFYVTFFRKKEIFWYLAGMDLDGTYHRPILGPMGANILREFYEQSWAQN